MVLKFKRIYLLITGPGFLTQRFNLEACDKVTFYILGRAAPAIIYKS